MFFERPETGERAVLVHLEMMNNEAESEDQFEFQELVASAGAEPVSLIVAKGVKPNPKYLIGQGKVEEIRLLVQQNNADIVLFNHALSPSQERNLERRFECRVHDRTALILDIFAQRARTHEGKLQVELAQLQYMSTRLVRGWTHLERQKGGIGLRGPGETQLETDRRLLRVRIKNIRARLEKVRKQRDQGRRSRSKADIPTVSLVGYTNAGKSTLFNCLTEANVYVEDQLFATLDPTLRRLDITELGPIVLADTVGFIRHLPHKLVEAFRTTLQETAEATLLLHVVDAADDNKEANLEQVNLVLSEIKAARIPCLQVYNKIDLLDGSEPRIDRDITGLPWRVWVSSESGSGLDLLTQAIRERLSQDVVCKELKVSANEGGLRSKLYQEGAVLNETVNEEGDYLIWVRLPRQNLNRLLARR